MCPPGVVRPDPIGTFAHLRGWSDPGRLREAGATLWSPRPARPTDVDLGAEMTTVVTALVRGLGEIGLSDANSVGGKAANLGELIGAGFPVPPGFVLPAQAYLDAMDLSTVRGELTALHGKALA